MVAIKHLGIIVDGNRRWAKRHGKTIREGHETGFNKLQQMAAEAFSAGVMQLSYYLFSTENWSRDRREVRDILDLLTRIIEATVPGYADNHIRLVHIGRKDRIPQRLVEVLAHAEAATRQNSQTLNLAIDYGARDEMTRDLDLAKARPDLDLLIRTSGEQRLSNFMIWEAAYAELVFHPTFWPAFTRHDLHTVLDEFQARQRRYGK